MSAVTLWAVHVEGPDDVIACIDKDAAGATAHALNEIIERVSSPMSPRCVASVIEWPYGMDAWVAALEERK